MKIRELIDEVESELEQISQDAKDGEFDSVGDNAKNALDTISNIREIVGEIEQKSDEIKDLSKEIADITY